MVLLISVVSSVQKEFCSSVALTVMLVLYVTMELHFDLSLAAKASVSFKLHEKCVIVITRESNFYRWDVLSFCTVSSGFPSPWDYITDKHGQVCGWRTDAV